MASSLASSNSRRHVSFTTRPGENDLDISIVYFNPEDVFSPLSSSVLPYDGSISPTDNIKRPSGLPACTPSISRPTTMHPQACSPRPEPVSQPVRIVDVTLSSPFELVHLPCSNRSRSSTTESQVELIEKPRPLHIRRQQDKRQDLPLLAIPPLPALGFIKEQVQVPAKTLDLIEPRTRFTQMIGPNIIFEQYTGKTYPPSLSSDIQECSYFSPLGKPNPAKTTLKGLVTGIAAFSDWLVQVCKHQTNKQDIAWEMMDEEALAESQAHHGRVGRILKDIDDQVQQRGGVAFTRPDLTADRTLSPNSSNHMPFPNLKPEKGNIAHPTLKPALLATFHPTEAVTERKHQQKIHNRMAKGKCVCDLLRPRLPSVTQQRPTTPPCLPACRIAQVAWREKTAERRRIRKAKWDARKRSILATAKEVLDGLAAWPAEFVSWIGEYRGLSWLLLLMVVGLLGLGMGVGVGGLVGGRG